MDLAIIKTWAKGCLNVTASWYFFGVDVRKRRTVLPIYFFLFVLLNLTPVISDFYVVLIDGILEQIWNRTFQSLQTSWGLDLGEKEVKLNSGFLRGDHIPLPYMTEKLTQSAGLSRNGVEVGGCWIGGRERDIAYYCGIIGSFTHPWQYIHLRITFITFRATVLIPASVRVRISNAQVYP